MEGFTVLAIAKRSVFGFVCGSSTKKDIKSFCHLQIRPALCRIRLRSQQRIVTYLNFNPRPLLLPSFSLASCSVFALFVSSCLYFFFHSQIIKIKYTFKIELDKKKISFSFSH